MSKRNKYEEDRESFFARLRPLLCFSDLTMVELAYELAKNGMRPLPPRKAERHPVSGEPIRAFEHVRRVTLIFIDEIGCALPTGIIAGLLHDTPEDSRFPKNDPIEVIFGKEVAHVVRMLTKMDLGPGVSDTEMPHRLITFGGWVELVLKLCDRTDNLRSLKDAEPKFMAKQAKETREKYFAVFAEAIRQAPERYKERCIRLRDECVRMVETYEERLAQLAAATAAADVQKSTH